MLRLNNTFYPGMRSVLIASFVLILNACSTMRSSPAPVEDKKGVNSQGIWMSVGMAKIGASSASALGAENAGKPGYYTVKQGDTLIRIGLDQGQNWRDIVKWNNLDNPNNIEVGQVLRVQAPNSNASTNASATDNNAVLVRPVASASQPSNATSTPAPGPNTAQTNKPLISEAADEIVFSWPANGALNAYFDEIKNKGIDIVGKAGEPVLAAADGKVVYAGSGLRGYGNLIILKHNNTYLSAYAHNQTLLVKEDQSIKRGQKIAEMGNTDSDQVKLHFEVRKQGKPIDPVKMLPPR